MALTLVPSEGARVQVSTDGSNWMDVPGVASYTVSGGEAPTRTVTAFEGTAQVTGRPQPQTIELDATAPVLAHPAWTTMYSAFQNGNILNFRLITEEVEVREASAGNTLGIATTGIVTFAAATGSTAPDFTGNSFNVGMALKVGTGNSAVYHLVSKVTTAGVVTVSPAPGSAVAPNTQYAIVVPRTRQGPFTARVTTSSNISLASEADLASNASLAAVGVLPNPVLMPVAPAE